MSSNVAGAPPRRHRLSVQAYRRMAEAGILAPDARTELIEGEILDMPPIGSRHAGTVKHLVRLLQHAIDHAGVADAPILQVQDPVVLDEHSMPQPDLALLRARPDFYKSAHPTAGDVLLIIEIADASLRYDTEVKLPLYARHGIAEVWVLDVDGQRLTRHREPGPGGYERGDAPDLATAIAIGDTALTVNLGDLLTP